MKKEFLVLILFLLLITSCSNQVNINKHQFTLEEKVGQLIITIPPLNSDNLTLSQLFNDYYVSGFIYMNWENDIKNMTQEEIIKYTKSLQKQSKFPLFISADIEGGEINRIKSFYPLKTFQHYGSAYEKTDNREKLLQEYRQDVKNLALKLRELGINLNFAPVLDVEQTLDHGVLSKHERAYSTNKDTVTALGKIYLSELESNQVFSTIKHFPGHGHTNCDTYERVCGVNVNLEEYKSVDLVPFKEAIKENPSFVMIGLFTTPYDEENRAVMSKAVVTDLLRNELKFKGVVITDDYMMGSVKDLDRSELTINSLNAGVDMFLTTNTNDVPLIYDAIMQALQNGEITEERIDQSFARVLKLKKEIKVK